MAIGAGKYWFNGLPVDGLSGPTAGATKYWFNGLPYDTIATGAAPSGATGTVNSTQDSQTVVATGSSGIYPAAELVQDSQSISAAAISQATATLNLTQANNVAPPPTIFVAAPSYGTWVKRQNKSKPQAPQLPPPVEAGEVVIDEAVLRQMEEERLAALVLQKKTEARQTNEMLRASVPVTEGRASRSMTLRDNTFDRVETTPEVRRAVVTLFRPAPRPALVEPVRGSTTLRALGPRYLPEPEIRKSRTISLRRSTP